MVPVIKVVLSYKCRGGHNTADLESNATVSTSCPANQKLPPPFPTNQKLSLPFPINQQLSLPFPTTRSSHCTAQPIRSSHRPSQLIRSSQCLSQPIRNSHYGSARRIHWRHPPMLIQWRQINITQRTKDTQNAEANFAVAF